MSERYKMPLLSIAEEDDLSPFWERKTLAEMTQAEWESLCDGCGKCCLFKLRDEDTDAVYFTNTACRLLDIGTCRCRHYPERKRYVPDCVTLTPQTVAQIDWLPATCAYRRLGEGRGLAWWHPLVSGDPDTVHQAGISVRGRVESEAEVGSDDLEHRLVDWPDPGRLPSGLIDNQ